MIHALKIGWQAALWGVLLSALTACVTELTTPEGPGSGAATAPPTHAATGPIL